MFLGVYIWSHFYLVDVQVFVCDYPNMLGCDKLNDDELSVLGPL